ncbi:MAG: DUF1343 domain-containing protein [Actinomycetota bacterium]
MSSGCGSSSGPAAGSASSTTVRSEPVSGRDDRAPTEAEQATDPDADAADADPATTATSTPGTGPIPGDAVVTGAQVLVGDGFGPLLGRRVGLIANRASTVDGERLIDRLNDHPDVELVAIFAPEHGVEAVDGAGEIVLDGVDEVTGVPVQSLYDDDRAPAADVLAELDILVFDLQDAGARFYTYVSTLGLAMQAAADAEVPMLVLDRPNPLGGNQADGPILVDDQRSFVGLYPVPALTGLTIGELALAIWGEGWLDGVDGLELEVIGLQGWDRSQRWDDTGLAWTAPSPGLPEAELALLYPSTVFLEASTLSFGRGSDRPFGQFGAPWLDASAMVDRLEAAGLAGVAFEEVVFADATDPAIPGVRLTVTDPATIRPLAIGVHILHHLLAVHGDQEVIDRPDFLDLLAGSSALRDDLEAGRDPAAIVESWSDDLAAWSTLSAPYQLYPDQPGG